MQVRARMCQREPCLVTCLLVREPALRPPASQTMASPLERSWMQQSKIVQMVSVVLTMKTTRGRCKRLLTR